MVDGAKQLNLSLDMIASGDLGLLDGLDGVLLTGGSTKTLTNASIVSGTNDGGVDVIVGEDIAVPIIYNVAAREIDGKV
eukprot:CAMPEP_0201927622 /NCGR_PEP_ID=MMETSP0903-20130614/19102_1 /ASSEMBLY_ACC=CAM_ASM_000552 /TAXON_ID=420261 /ORGANISM="Thalassiosira antarctica, Strain CCMP982" /LENGTH=78 /DNA_ID=CAMNT_0048465875 /DNA_START=162 /DNA_END=398 /DNA_ORIENTATION=-